MDVRRYREPPDPPPPPPPPKGAEPSATPGIDASLLKAENGAALPSVYGTARVDGNIVERFVYVFASSGQDRRQKSTAYVIGDIRLNQGNLYIVRIAGTTGTGDGPSGTGAGQTDGSVTWDYVKMGYRHKVAIAFAEGQVYGAGKAWQDKNKFAAYTDIQHDSIFLDFQLGAPAGFRPAWWPVTGTGINDIYGNTAILWSQFSTGSDADLPTTSLEVKGIFADGTHVDANPADIAIDLLTHSRRGAQWPSAMVDSVSTGTGNAGSWKNYCTAAGFTLSWAIDSQQSALDLIGELLAATNTDMVWTNRADGLGGMLKFVPLGTDRITANGADFQPNLTPVYALGFDDLLRGHPIEIDVVPSTETFNSFPIEYVDRATDYKRLTVDDPDMSDVDVRGLVRANTTSIPMVISPTAAIQLSRIKAQRSLNVRNTYKLSLPWKYMLVEPTDIVTATDSNLGLSAQPMRVTVFEEDQSGGIVLTCEDFPAAVGAAATYTPQTNDGFKPTVSTALAALSVLPGQVPANVVPDATSTRGGSVGNLFPNPISETSPPDGVDTTTAEWAGRSQAVAAVTGTWTRTPGLGASLTINYDVAAAPAETYYFEAQVKATAAAANKGGFLKIEAFDKDGASLGSAVSSENDTTSFVRALVSFLMPANTIRARFSLVNGTDANAQAYFDVIYARKAITAGVIASGQVVTGHMSLGQYNTLNLWPNPNSESSPPASYAPPGDGTDGEYDFRYNEGVGVAYSGEWVRRLQRTSAGAQILKLIMPASATEAYTVAAQCKWVSTGGLPTFSLFLEYLDKDFVNITGNAAGVPTSQTAYGFNSHTATAPTGTVYVKASFALVTASAGTAEVRFDAINFIRRINGSTGIVDGTIDTLQLHTFAVTDVKIADENVTSAKLYPAVIARYYKSAAQSIPHATYTIINFSTSDWDNVSAVTTGASWKFTCPSGCAGVYKVSAHVSLDGANQCRDYLLSVFKNGTEWARLSRLQAPLTAGNINADTWALVGGCGSASVKLTDGDYVDIRIYQASADSGNRNTEGGSVTTWVAIEQLYGPKY